MPHRSRVSHFTAATWKAAADASRVAGDAAEQHPAMTALELAMWNAGQAAIDALMTVVSTPPLGGGPFFEIDLAVVEDGHDLRSVSINVTYRK